MGRRFFVRMVTALAWCTCLPVDVAEAATEPVKVTLQASSDPADIGTTKMLLTITNDGDLPVTLCRYMIPFEWVGQALPGNQFDVYDLDHAGAPVDIVANFTYFDTSADSAYVDLEPHRSMSGIIDLRPSFQWPRGSEHFTAQFILRIGSAPDDKTPDPHASSYETQPNRMRDVVSNTLPFRYDRSLPSPSEGLATESRDETQVAAPWSALFPRSSGNHVAGERK